MTKILSRSMLFRQSSSTARSKSVINPILGQCCRTTYVRRRTNSTIISNNVTRSNRNSNAKNMNISSSSNNNNIFNGNPVLDQPATGTTTRTSKIVLLRHGQSIWNKIPTFSGWCDVPLTDLGIDQAVGAAKVMKEREIHFDLAFSSKLQRAYRSAQAVLQTMEEDDDASAKNDDTTSTTMSTRTTTTPIIQAWELNERHYGALQGLAKNNPELHIRYGTDKMIEWRRSMMGKPPPMDEYHPHFAPPPSPLTESLYDCQQRVVRYWNETIVPSAAEIAASSAAGAVTSSTSFSSSDVLLPPQQEQQYYESTILIAAHANTIRALIAYLDDISHEDVPKIHIPNSVPCVYIIDTQTGKAIQQDASPLSTSRGYWIVCADNQSRLLEKLGSNSEAFARSVFDAWDVDKDGLLTKEELLNGLSTWKRDHSNPAINTLAGKIWEEVCVV
jgi:2,3-bisphosphoglycerate-dependent phosphoglycerate mutase